MSACIHLILDEQCVAHSQGVSFHLNRATKHPENPVLIPGEPHEWDSLQVSWPGTVLYSPRDQKFRCWYCGFDAIQTPERYWAAGYAESADGVHWTKPKLDQVTFLDRRTNQIQPEWARRSSDPQLPWWGQYRLYRLVFENPLPEAPPQQRFGGYWMFARIGEDGKFTEQQKLGWSADGIHWKLADTAYEIQPYDRFRWHDTSQILHDPDDPNPDFRIKVYSQYFSTRAYDGREQVRHIGMLHGRAVEHFESLSNPVIFGPEQGLDEEIHYAGVMKTGQNYLMLFESDRFSQHPIHGDLRLAVSTDGIKFRRVHPRFPLVPTGPKGTWDENLLVTSSAAMQAVGDEVYIFYFGCPNTYTAWPSQYQVVKGRGGYMFAPVYLGLAKLPRDSFGYAAGPGELTTHVLDLSQGELWINADGDRIVLSALDQAGRVAASGQLSDERRHTVYRKVIWNGDVPREGSLIKLQRCGK